MKPEDVLDVYDGSYAAKYDEKYILGPSVEPKTVFELDVLKSLTCHTDAWLDVACGTGYFLEQGSVGKALRLSGLDISPYMLEVAHKRNPQASFICADFLDPQPSLENSFGLTTLLWGAYALQHTTRGIFRLVNNLWTWTRENGTCFMPVFDPSIFVAQRERGHLPDSVTINADGTKWSYYEKDGKQHLDLHSPPTSTMVGLFECYFEDVETFQYPEDAEWIGLMGLIARGRRLQPHVQRLREQSYMP